MLLASCGAKVVETKTIYVRVPENLLVLRELSEPKATDIKGVISAYIELFEAYQECKININSISELNDKF